MKAHIRAIESKKCLYLPSKMGENTIPRMDLATRRQQEIDFWKHAQHEKPGELSILNIINKFSESRVFIEKIQQYGALFLQSKNTLELGGGQGVHSCILKSLFPQNNYTVSDISPYAIESTPQWESLLKVELKDRLACPSDMIPVPDETYDLVFCFQAAHHFVTHRETLQEVHRILQPGGTCLYLHEPSCTRFMHPYAYKRVNRKRHEVTEDLLIYRDMQAFASEVGFQTDLHFAPTLTGRGPKETLYYALLGKIPTLQRTLPCTVDYRFFKNPVNKGS
ncbi:MAG: class I SAM-dependent methyltransferase [Leptolyngbya sp. SIO3F4]|nr:class I SAM-dependent methyltransferase [Leptolyngbya sp. SIO3F4]